MFELKLLGSVTLSAVDGPVAGAAVQRRRLALLSLIAATPGGIGRDKAIGILWPDTATEQARRLLADSIYVLRRSLAPDALVAAGDNVQLNDALMQCDVVRFRAACAASDLERAARLYAGPFLDGFALADAPEFELWADAMREDLARMHARTLEQLARTAEVAGDYGAAAAWWSRLQAVDLLNSRIAIAFMEACAAAGDAAAALRHAKVHEALLQSELGIAPPAELGQLVERLRTAPIASSDAEPGVVVSAASPADASPDAAPRIDAPVPSPLSNAPAPSRPRVPVALVAAALLLVALAGIGALVAAREPTDPASVYVAVFDNETGDVALDPLGRMAADWIARGLVSAGELHVFSPGWIGSPDAPAGRTAARTAAREARARTLVAGAYYRDGDRVRFDAQVIDSRTGSLLQALEPIQVPADSASAGIELLRQRVTAALAARLAAPVAHVEITTRSQPPTFAAYRNYVDGVQLFSRYEVDRAAERFSAAWSLDTTFHLAALYEVLLAYNRGDVRRGDSIVDRLALRLDHMAGFDRALFGAFERERAGDHQGVLRAMRRVAGMAPGSQFAVGRAVAAIAANEPREALDVLLQLDPTAGMLRDNPRYWDWRTTARHLLGEHRQELADVRVSHAHHAFRRTHLLHEIRARAALGQVDEVDRLLHEAVSTAGARSPGDVLRTAALELRAHGQPDGAANVAARLALEYRSRPADEQTTARALALYEVGLPAEAAALLDLQPDRGAQSATSLALRGLLAARRGDREAAVETSRQLATDARLQRRGAATLWRARIAAALDDEDAALRLLGEAFEQGLQHGLWLHTDPDLAPLLTRVASPRPRR